MTEVAISTDPRGRIFITPEAFADMDAWHATAAEIRRDEPVMRVEAEGWTPFWAITKHADVFEVSRRSDVFFNTEKSAPGPDLQYDMLQAFGIELPRTLVHIHGDVHNKLRSVTNDWFKPAAVRHLQPTIESIADEFVAATLKHAVNRGARHARRRRNIVDGCFGDARHRKASQRRF